jgi:electron-transferring-flavoprotein dehydrogenase
MLAAEAVAEHFFTGVGGQEVSGYPSRLASSWVWEELHRVRNIRPSFQFGLWGALAYAAVDTYLFRGQAPWTLHHRHSDHQTLVPAHQAPPIDYPRPDGTVSFDRLSSVALANVAHEENQPVHLRLRDPRRPIDHNLALYDAPEQRYCPAGVYEIVRSTEGTPRLQINASNCVHCKTCDIKDPTQNILWTVPEGGGGPNYPNM